MSHEIELLTEIRDLLQVMAEPALAKRDEKQRALLRTLVGDSDKKAKAVLLMDGSRSQSVIVKEVGIDQGYLSRLIKALAAGRLITTDVKHPQLLVKIPSNLFETDCSDE